VAEQRLAQRRRPKNGAPLQFGAACLASRNNHRSVDTRDLSIDDARSHVTFSVTYTDDAGRSGTASAEADNAAG